MARFNVALSDRLQLEYSRYKHGEEFRAFLINRILRYSEDCIITNTAQLKRIGRDTDRSLMSRLASSSLTDQTLEELAAKTRYRIILSDENDVYPYVNISGGMKEPVQPMLGGCFFRNTGRDKAKAHLRGLCEGAKSIVIYDAHISDGAVADWMRNVDTLAGILPVADAVELVHHPAHLSDAFRDRLSQRCPNVTFTSRELPTHHDRYIEIDRRMEVIITSGFYYIESSAKELTYIVRPVGQTRFTNP